MGVRVATEPDIPAIFDVRTSVRQNHLSLEALERLGITPASVAGMIRSTMRAWVAEEDGGIVGFAMADAATASVFALFVRPTHEGRGWGRALLREAEEWLFAGGCERIWLRTDRDPTVRANGFYVHVGWSCVGVQEDGQNEYVRGRGGG